MKEKLYYDPFKSGTKRKRHYFLSKIVLKILTSAYARKVKIEFESPLPDAPVMICANHAREFGPFALMEKHPRPFRPWSHADMLKIATIPKHNMEFIFPHARGMLYYILYFLSWILAYPYVSAMHSLESIPVFMDRRINLTIKKSTETLNDGKDLVIFPECSEPKKDYKFVNEVKRGVAFAIKDYIETTNKPVTIIPTYVCQSLKIIKYGRPLEISSCEDYRQKSKDIAKYIMDEIERLGNSLPPHKITPYDDKYVEKKMKKNKNR